MSPFQFNIEKIDRVFVLSMALLIILFTFNLEAVAQQATLPRGSTFGDLESSQTVRIFRSETQNGQRSYESIAGELMFEAPLLLGGLARDIGMSCDTCHIRGGSNPDFFIPGASTRRGTFNRAPYLFSKDQFRTIEAAITIPSLIGIAGRTRFGHDGRTASLSNFINDVITNEFFGSTPSPRLLDFITAYVNDLDKRPNKRLVFEGKIIDPTEAEKRGGEIFHYPFGNQQNGCATCHQPGNGFSDDHLYNLSSETKFLRTPRLIDRIEGQPYFYDGRAVTLHDVVFDKNTTFDLHLNSKDKNALVAYLTAVQSADYQKENVSVARSLEELEVSLRGLKRIVKEENADIVIIASDGFAHKLQIMATRFENRIADIEGDKIRQEALSIIAEAAIATFQLRSAAERLDFLVMSLCLNNVEEKIGLIRQPALKAEKYSLYDIVLLSDYRKKILNP